MAGRARGARAFELTVVVVSLSLGLVGCDALRERATPSAAPAPAAASCAPGPDAEVVSVDWLGRGSLYAGTVIGRRADLTGIRYADGEREWVVAERIAALPDLSGRAVTVWTRGSASAVTISEQREGLVHARFSDGSHTWFEAGALYQLETPRVERPTPPDGAPSFAVRRPAEPAGVQVGGWVLAYWDPGSGVNRSRPWLARVTSRGESTVHLSYRDGSEGEAPLSSVLRVFEPPYRARRGERVWLSTAAGATGAIVETRADLFSVRIGEQTHWLEASDLLAAAPPAPRARIVVGSHVTALWQGTTPYHGDIARLEGEQVYVLWHDGSGPDAIAIDDVVEVWEAAAP